MPNADSFARQDAIFGPPKPTEYAFTEMLTVRFASSVDLEDRSTPESRLLEATIRTYADDSGTMIVRWGQDVLDGRNRRIFVDWRSKQARITFLSSPPFTHLFQTWRTCPIPFSARTPLRILLQKREIALSPASFLPSAVSVHLTFPFPNGFDAEAPDPLDTFNPRRSKYFCWQNAWDNFSHQTLRSDGGVVASGSTSGWSLGAGRDGDGASFFFGGFRFRDREIAELYFLGGEGEKNRLGRLKELCDGEVRVEIMKVDGEIGG